MHSQYRRRRPANSSTIDQQILNEDTEPTKKRNYRFTRISCYGYRKQVWRLGVILWVLTAIGIFCCFSRIDGSWKFLCSFYSPGVLKFAALDGNKKLAHYENDKYGDVYDWGNEANNDERRNYPGISSSLSDQKPIFTFFTEKDSEKLMGMKKSFEEMQSNGMLLPCRLDDGDSCFKDIELSFLEGFSKLLRSSKKTGTVGPRMLLHNPLQEDRFWCGKRILGGGGTLEFTDFPDECEDERYGGSLPYIYSKSPPTLPNKGASGNSKQVEAVELFWNTDYDSATIYSDASLKLFPCSIPCKLNDKYLSVNVINVRNTNWTITHTMEGEQIYPEARLRASAYRRNQFYATTSFKSEIPLPYFSWQEYNIQQTAVDFRKVIKGASFLANNCESLNNREKVVEALIKSPLRVDSLSGCLNNAEPLPNVDMQNKTAVMEQYLFHLAFENQKTEDYITEKVWGALASGTLPVYLGAKNVKEHVPKNSIIVAEDFKSPEDLADYLIQLTNDKDLYESYHKWRHEPIDDTFASKYEFTNTHSNCRMCKWVFAKRHGLGWNHSKQTISKPHIDHKTCRNEMGLIGYPFKEYWLSSTVPSEGVKSAKESEIHVFSTETTKGCTLTEENRVLTVNHGAVRRKVYDRDGVTDLIIDVTKGESEESSDFDHYILRFKTPLEITETNLEPRVVSNSTWWLQDDYSRFYFMVSGDEGIKLSLHKPGIPELYIPSPTKSGSTITVRVRVVTENIDHFHQKTKKTPGYFGDLMTRDFFNPLASYRIRN